MNNSYTNFKKFPNFKKTPSAFLNTLKKGEKVFKTSKCFCGCDITYGTKYDEYDIYTHPHFKNKKCIKFIYNFFNLIKISLIISLSVESNPISKFGFCFNNVEYATLISFCPNVLFFLSG